MVTTVLTELRMLPLLTHAGVRTTRATETVVGVDGRPLAELSLAPDLLVSQALQAQKLVDALPVDERTQRFAEASARFLEDDLAGVTLVEHLRLVAASSGHGARVTHEATRAVAKALAEAPLRADQGRPIGSVSSWEEAVAGSGRGVWTRRGETLAAVLAGNSPTIQNGWLQALALGFRVAVRPSRREPFTAFRVVSALRAAGFRDIDAVFLPTHHAGASTLLRRADLGFVYGGDDVAARYGDSASVKVAGPGRSKTLLTGHVSDAAVEALADAVSSGSGSGCVNTTGVYVHGDHEGLAERLAAVLLRLVHERRDAGDHLGPRVNTETADGVRRLLGDRARTARSVISLDDVVTAHPDGGFVLGPAVFVVDDAHDERLTLELPFPCAWVAPWSPSDGVSPFRDSLVVNAVTRDSALIDAFVRDPSIRNVYVDRGTAHSDGKLPHEGFVGDFLMENKAVVGR